MKPENSPHDVRTSNARDLQARDTHSTDKTDQHTNHCSGLNDNGKPNKKSTGKATTDQTGLNAAQQQFVLKFCRQLASVIQACDQKTTTQAVTTSD